MAEIDDLVAHWSEAERQGDFVALDSLLHDEFRGIGPLGFVLTKQQWLDRYRDGDLVNDAFSFDDVDVRTYGDTTIAIGIQLQTSAYRGQDASGRFRSALVALRDGDELSIVHVQVGMLAGPASSG